MRIGISRPSGTPEDAMALFSAARAAGFDGVQVKPQQYDLWDRDPQRCAEALGELASMLRAGLVAYPGPNPERWPEDTAPMVDLAGGVGAEEICLCSGVSPSDLQPTSVSDIAGILNDIGEAALAKAAHLSLHNHADSLFETADDLDALVEHLDPRLCGLTFDTAHAAKGGMTDLAEHIARFAEYIRNVHLKDMSAEGRFCPLGEGVLDLEDALESLDRIGYEGWLIVDEESEGLSHEQACGGSADFLKRQGAMP